MKKILKITGIAIGSVLLLVLIFLASIPLWFPVKDAKELLIK